MKIESVLNRMGKTFREKGIAKRVLDIPLSPIKEMELAASKIDGVVSLGQGIPSFPTPRHICDAATAALAEGQISYYSLDPGYPALREAVSEKLLAQNGITVDPDSELTITVGASEAFSAAVMVLIDKGQEAIIPEPAYPAHIEAVYLADGQPRMVPLVEEEGWRLDLDQIRAAVTDKTAAIIVNTPHNPTGSVFPRKDLKEVANIALEHELAVISDETYEQFTYDGHAHYSIGTVQELWAKGLAVSCFTLSKTYAMTGWRVGYVVARSAIIDHLLKVHDCFAICAPTISQIAALTALRGPQMCVDVFRQKFQERRDQSCEWLNRLGWTYQKPHGAYYILPVIPSHDSYSYSIELLQKAKVNTIPGASFGQIGEGHIRLSYCMDESTIDEAYQRIERASKAS
jgi:aminotransferase